MLIRDLPDVLHTLVDTAADQGGCLNIDVHDYVYDETLFPNWAKTYNALLQHIVARSDFWVDTPKRVANHWETRRTNIANASQGLIGTVI